MDISLYNTYQDSEWGNYYLLDPLSSLQAQTREAIGVNNVKTTRDILIDNRNTESQIVKDYQSSNGAPPQNNRASQSVALGSGRARGYDLQNIKPVPKFLFKRK